MKKPVGGARGPINTVLNECMKAKGGGSGRWEHGNDSHICVGGGRWKWRQQSGEAHSFVCWCGAYSEKKRPRLQRGPQFRWLRGGGSGEGKWSATTRGGAISRLSQARPLWMNGTATRARLRVALSGWGTLESRWVTRQSFMAERITG